MKKHFMSAFLALFMTASALTACTPAGDVSTVNAAPIDSVQTETAETQTETPEASGELSTAAESAEVIDVQFWHTRGSGANQETVDYQIASFNETIGAEKGINVVGTFIGGYPEIVTKVQLSSQSGEQPALSVIGNTHVGWLMEDDLLADMAPLAEASGYDMNDIMKPFFMIYGNTDGQMYSVPYIRSTPLFWYNKTMAEEKGLTPPTTIAELEAFCKAMYEADETTGEVLVYGFEMPNDFGYLLAANLVQLGSGMLSEDGTNSPALEDGAMLKVMTDWRRWVDEGWCRPFGSTAAGTTVQELFNQGKIGAYISSSGGTKNIIETAEQSGFEVGAMPYPTYDANIPTTQIGGGNLVIVGESNDDKTINAAWEFVKYTLSPEMGAYNSINSGYLPVTYSAGQYPEMVDFWTDNPLYKVAYDQLETAIPQEYPYVPFLQDYIQACADASSLLIQDNSITPEEAVEMIATNTAGIYN